jgi:hypothetical protein
MWRVTYQDGDSSQTVVSTEENFTKFLGREEVGVRIKRVRRDGVPYSGWVVTPATKFGFKSGRLEERVRFSETLSTDDIGRPIVDCDALSNIKLSPGAKMFMHSKSSDNTISDVLYCVFTNKKPLPLYNLEHSYIVVEPHRTRFVADLHYFYNKKRNIHGQWEVNGSMWYDT